MVMKRIIFIIATAAVSGIVACCSKVTSDADIEQASGFSLNILMPQTKTVFNGQTYEVDWETGDEIGVVIDDGTKADLYKFTKSSGEDNSFVSTEFSPEEGREYTYYVLYPYEETFSVSDGKSNDVVNISSGKQAATDDAGHIKTPLYGMGTASGVESPAITLHHAASVIKINVANYSGSELPISEVGLTSVDENAVMSGTFSIDFIDGVLTAAENAVSCTATVSLEAVYLPNGASADFYVAVAPFATDADLSVLINDEEFEKNGVSYDFKAGYVYTSSVTYGTPEVAVEAGGEAVGTLSRTLEDENVYANLVELSAGEADITLQFNGDKYYLCPADGTFSDGAAVKASLQKTAGTKWSIPADDTYRIVFNKLGNTVRIYSSANEFNKPRIVEFEYSGGDWIVSRELTSGTYYVRGANQWYNGEAHQFSASLADPRILVCNDAKITVYENFCIKLARYIGDITIVEEGVKGPDPVKEAELAEKDSKEGTFVSHMNAFSTNDGKQQPLVLNEWLSTTCMHTNNGWTLGQSSATVDMIILDVRNDRVYFKKVQ